MHNSKLKLIKKYAYVLTEILISIGIVLAILVLIAPTINSSSDKRLEKNLVRRTVLAKDLLSKSYNRTITDLAMAERSKNEDPLSFFDDMDEEKFKKAFENYLDISAKESCEYDVCLIQGVMFNYDNNYSKGCKYDASERKNKKSLQSTCMSITVDVNSKRKPNEPGKDRYKFWVTKYGIEPAGSTDKCSGLDCASYVIANNELWQDNSEEDSEDYVLKNQNDNSSIPNCLFEKNNICKRCYFGYMVKNGVCVLLEELNCSKSDDGKTCSLCADGYEKNKKDECVKIPEIPKNTNTEDEEKQKELSDMVENTEFDEAIYKYK